LRIFFRVLGIGDVAGRILANFFNPPRKEIEVQDGCSSLGLIAVCLTHVGFYFARRMQLLPQKIKVKDTSSSKTTNLALDNVDESILTDYYLGIFFPVSGQ